MDLRSAPVLETERLILRPFEKGDFEDHLRIMSKPEVHRFLGPAMSREHLWRRTVSSVGMWTVMGFGAWMVVSKSDRQIIGNTGFFEALRGLKPCFEGDPEMGWIFDPEAHGRGLALEACTAALGWADTNLAPTPIWAIADPENERSLRLAHKLGFQHLGDSVYHDAPIAILKRGPERAVRGM